MEYAYVGSYTTKERGGLGCGGISAFCREQSDSPWKEIQVWQGKNPSFLALNSTGDRLYAVEADGDTITAFATDDGRLEKLNTCHTGFINGVHLEVGPKNDFLFVASAHHTGGGLTVIRLMPDGSLGEICDTKVPDGELGPLTKIQNCTLPHQIKFDRAGCWQLEANRAQDCVRVWRTDEVTGKMSLVSTMKWRPGSCPRHVDFHPSEPFAYLLTEWFGTVVSCKYENGYLTPIECLPTIPETFLGMKNSAAEIEVHPNGKFLYVSNREQNSICEFRIKADGRLSRIGWCTEGISKPRFFAIALDGKSLYCANEISHCVTQYAIDPETGVLQYLSKVMEAGAPACIVFRHV